MSANSAHIRRKAFIRCPPLGQLPAKNSLSVPKTSGVRPPDTAGELLKRLGNIPAGRVRLYPTPGTATEKGLIRIPDRENRPGELVEGTLVEKAMGYEESRIAVTIIILLGFFVRRRKLGIVTGPDGTIKLFAGLVRIPDVSFVCWGHLPESYGAIPPIAPDLAVEVASRSQYRPEMAAKAQVWLTHGARLLWVVWPRRREVDIWHPGETQAGLTLIAADTLGGEDVLPGFSYPVASMFV